MVYFYQCLDFRDKRDLSFIERMELVLLVCRKYMLLLLWICRTVENTCGLVNSMSG